jgi:hypothetical protein
MRFSDVLLRFIVHPTRGFFVSGHEQMGSSTTCARVPLGHPRRNLCLALRKRGCGVIPASAKFSRRRPVRVDHDNRVSPVTATTRIGRSPAGIGPAAGAPVTRSIRHPASVLDRPLSSSQAGPHGARPVGKVGKRSSATRLVARARTLAERGTPIRRRAARALSRAPVYVRRDGSHPRANALPIDDAARRTSTPARGRKRRAT